MSAAPTDWADEPIESFGEILGGGTPSRATASFWGGSIPWVTPTDITALRGKHITDTPEKITNDGLLGSAAKLLPIGTVVVTTRATLGEAAIAGVPLTTNQGFKNIVPNETTDSVFTYHLLKTLRPAMLRLASGTTFPEISKKDFSRIRVPRPNRYEQSRIAAVLDTADEAIAKTEAVIAKLRQVRTGLIHDLLTCGLDENGHLRDPIAHPEQFQKTSLGLLPSAWQIVSVDTAGEVRLGRQRSPAYDHGEFMFPYLRVANVFDCFIDYSDVLRMNFTPQEQRQYGLQPGDILLNEGQSLELVGRSAMYRGEPGMYCFQNSLVRFRANQQVAVPDYCQLVFHYWLHAGRFTTVAKQTTSVAHLGADRFAKMSIALPAPSEQRDIAAMLSHQDQLIATTEAELTKLQSIKSGLMDDLLTGRVRVPESTP